MEQIVQNLSDPSWWFTGTFFVLVGLLLTKLFFHWLPSALSTAKEIVPRLIARLYRKRDLAIARRVKRYRQYEVKINWLIARYWSIATITLVYLGFVSMAFLLYPDFHGSTKNKLSASALFLPAYAMQFLTMWEKEVVARAIKAHIRWIKRKHSTGLRGQVLQ